MTTSKEQEAFGLVVERHKSNASENDIRNAFQRFKVDFSRRPLSANSEDAAQTLPLQPQSPSNGMILSQSRCTALFQPQGRKPLDSPRASA